MLPVSLLHSTSFVLEIACRVQSKSLGNLGLGFTDESFGELRTKKYLDGILPLSLRISRSLLECHHGQLEGL